MKWQDKFYIGIATIDNQHKELFKIIGNLKEVSIKKDSGSKLIEALKFMVDYTKYHFAAEEEFMRRIAFTRLSKQKQLHQSFIEKLTETLVKLKNGHKVDHSKLLEFLIHWWTHHILQEDLLIKKFMEENYLDHRLVMEPIKSCTENSLLQLNRLQVLFNQNKLKLAEIKLEKGKIIKKFIEEVGISNFELAYRGLELFEKKNAISKSEIKSILNEIFEGLKIKDILKSISDIDSRLCFIKILYGIRKISEDQYLLLKDELLSSLINKKELS